MSKSSRRAIVLAAVGLAAIVAGAWLALDRRAPPEREGNGQRTEAVYNRYGLRKGPPERASDGVPRISAAELEERLGGSDRVVVLNTRAAPDEPTIPGALFVEEERLEAWAGSLPRSRPIVAYCSCPADAAAVRAALALRMMGFTDARVLEGGLEAWQKAGYPTAPPRR